MTGSQTCLVIIAWHCDITVGIYIRSLASLVFPGLTCRIYAGSSSLFSCSGTNAVAYHISKFVILIRFEPSQLSLASMVSVENGLAPLIIIISMLLLIFIT